MAVSGRPRRYVRSLYDKNASPIAMIVNVTFIFTDPIAKRSCAWVSSVESVMSSHISGFLPVYTITRHRKTGNARTLPLSPPSFRPWGTTPVPTPRVCLNLMWARTLHSVLLCAVKVGGTG